MLGHAYNYVVHNAISSQLAENYSIEVSYLQRALFVHPPADPTPDSGSGPPISDAARSPSCRNFWNPPKLIYARDIRGMVRSLFFSSSPSLCSPASWSSEQGVIRHRAPLRFSRVSSHPRFSRVVSPSSAFPRHRPSPSPSSGPVLLVCAGAVK
jgi:hypothetical protein